MDSKNLLDNLLKKHKDAHYNFATEVVDKKVSTGSLIVDSAMGGGYSYGIFRASGTSEGGKTSHFLDTITNFLNEETEDIHRCIYFKAEGRLSEKVQSRYNVKFTKDPADWDHGSVFIMECNIYETIAETIETLVKNAQPNEKYIFMLDSMDGAILKDDMAKNYGEAVKVSGPQVLTKLLLKRVSLPITKFGHRLFLISQHSAIIKGQYDKVEQMQTGGSGGNASIHFSDWIIQFLPWQYNKNYILEEGSGTKVEKDSQKSNIVGHWCKFEIKKSDNQTSGRTVEYPIRYNKDGSGNIWVEYEVFEFMLSTGMLKKKGPWLSLSEVGLEVQSQFKSIPKMEEEPTQWQGQKKAMAFLSENKEYMMDWYQFFLDFVRSDGV